MINSVKESCQSISVPITAASSGQGTDGLAGQSRCEDGLRCTG